ncbi:hypothetical protein ACEPXA_08995 [Pseudomonas paraeruginosa]|uniref:hypothetical protein n=1 Tax=Pseudomonas paraeruginosa TaxID=2994495 RepID=UPI00374A566F
MPRFQPPVEHIDLIPTPMDTWRAALDALIACAPGDTSDISCTWPTRTKAASCLWTEPSHHQVPNASSTD